VSAFGIDVMVLVSFDQFQFSETGKSSWAYWTLIGAYVVKGERNETRTMMDAVVYDIPSRAMLFHASGESSQAGRSTPVDQQKKMRQASEASFASATDDLIVNLDVALDQFAEQAASGTIRGEGTPAIAMVDEQGRPVQVGGGGGGFGGGALGGMELAIVAILLLAARRRRPA
jgi:rhombotail lipoprotein